jgi:hypothetical protein
MGYGVKRGSVLFFGDALARHALARVGDFGHDILTDDVASTDEADANGNRRAVPAEPSPYRRNHDFAVCVERRWICGGAQMDRIVPIAVMGGSRASMRLASFLTGESNCTLIELGRCAKRNPLFFSQQCRNKDGNGL